MAVRQKTKRNSKKKAGRAHFSANRKFPSGKGLNRAYGVVVSAGAGNGVRTRDPKLGKLVLCQLSYTRPRFLKSQEL